MGVVSLYKKLNYNYSSKLGPRRSISLDESTGKKRASVVNLLSDVQAFSVYDAVLYEDTKMLGPVTTPSINNVAVSTDVNKFW